MGRGSRVCLYQFVEMGDPEANRLSSPWVQVIESECWKHPLMFHVPRVNALLGHLNRVPWRAHRISPAYPSAITLLLLSVNPDYSGQGRLVCFCFFSPWQAHAGSPFAHYIHPEALLHSLRIYAFSWKCEEGLGVLGEPLVHLERIDMDLAFFQCLHCRNDNLSLKSTHYFC